MSGVKLGLALVLACVLLMTLAVPVLAVDYNPGVSVGQWVEYGNYVMDGQETDVSGTRVEIVAVSGKEVTVRTLTEYRNGTDETVDKIYNVETGTVDGTPATFPGGAIIAANLNEGDAIPPVDLGYVVNTTETRTYLGVSRSVNIVSYTLAAEGYTISETFTYDKASGMLLELEGETVVAEVTSTYSDSIVDTNIFEEATPTPTPSEGIPVEYLYVGVAVVIIVVVVAVIVLWKRSK